MPGGYRNPEEKTHPTLGTQEEQIHRAGALLGSLEDLEG